MPREVDAQDLERKWNARLRTPTTSPRIAAMAANAGLSCLFWSIVHPNGLPFAEIALPAGTEAEAIPIQLGTFRIVSESEDLARAAAGFRSRAIKEFSAAPGLPVTVRLYLPWFCVLPTVDAMGVPLRGALANTGLASGRVIVEPDCSLAGRDDVFVIGDLASYRHGTGRPLPGLAAVAMQQGRYVARVLGRRLRGKPAPPPFRYLDKGNMATIGRKKAVAEIAGLRFSGLFAWLTWLFVHLMYLAEFQNRVLVLVQWGWNYFTRNRSARLITEPVTEAAEDSVR